MKYFLHLLVKIGINRPRKYIDPGTGSMLFTVLIGAISVIVYGIRGLIIILKTSIGAKNTDKSKHEFCIYTDSKRYYNTFKSILLEFEKRKIKLLYLTQSDDDPVFQENYEYIESEYIGNKNSSFTKLNFINADILLSTTPSLDVYQWKRSKTCKYYIHIPHACSDITLYRMFGIDYYDALLLSGQFQIDQVRKLEKIRNLPPKDLQLAGLTYFDEMKIKKDAAEKYQNKLPVVLLAPTWGQSSLLNKYGAKLIDELISTGYKVIIRPHPQSFISDKTLIEELKSHYSDIEWNTDNDNFDVLNKSDILISDYSGVIFDYALVFDKPVIYTVEDFDDSVYDAHWLNDNLWTFEILPKIGEELKENSFKNIKELIDNALSSKKYAAGREEARKDAWTNIGNSAKIIVDYMIDKQKAITKKVDQHD